MVFSRVFFAIFSFNLWKFTSVDNYIKLFDTLLSQFLIQIVNITKHLWESKMKSNTGLLNTLWIIIPSRQIKSLTKNGIHQTACIRVNFTIGTAGNNLPSGVTRFKQQNRLKLFYTTYDIIDAHPSLVVWDWALYAKQV